MKCNENKFSDVVLLKLHLIAKCSPGTFPNRCPANTGDRKNVGSTLFQSRDVEKTCELMLFQSSVFAGYLSGRQYRPVYEQLVPCVKRISLQSF